MTSIESHASISALGSVKMEERKRPSTSEVDGTEPPLKRQATSVNGTKPHPDADMPWKDDLERYQKDAILRQMREYKREKQNLESQISDLSKRSAFHDDHLRIIDAWFGQMLDEVAVISNDLSAVGLNNESQAMFPSALLFENEEKFKSHLESHSEKIRNTIRALFKNSVSSHPDVHGLQQKVDQLLAAGKTHTVELNRLSTEKDQLVERLESASLRYILAEKKLDRVKSQIVQKTEQQATKASKEGTAGAAKDEKVAVKEEASNGQVDGSSPIEELEAAHKEILALSEKRKEQLEHLETENKRLNEELTSINIRLTSPTEDDFSKTELFKILKNQLEDMVKRVNDLEATNKELREEAQKLQAERSSWKERCEEEARAQIIETESQIARAETDLARIRNHRDELLADVNIRKATEDKEKRALLELKALAEARESRVVALEAELEGLKASTADTKADEDEATATDVDTLRDTVKRLQNDQALLNTQLESIEMAYRKAHSIASKKVNEMATWEETSARLTAEKAKADQKYFGAMKAKESKDQENRVLRAQNSKSSEIIAQLKDAAGAATGFVSKLEGQLAEAQDATVAVTNQNRSLQQKLSEQKFVADGIMTQISDMKKYVSEKDSSLHTAMQGRRAAESELVELKARLEETKKSLDNWKKRGVGYSNDEYESLRAIAICTVCRRNFKNTALKTCGHVFCNDCVSERLANRMRKCPNCGKAFGANDHMRVTL